MRLEWICQKRSADVTGAAEQTGEACDVDAADNRSAEAAAFTVLNVSRIGVAGFDDCRAFGAAAATGIEGTILANCDPIRCRSDVTVGRGNGFIPRDDVPFFFFVVVEAERQADRKEERQHRY